MIRLVAILGLIAPVSVWASPWDFGPPIDVAPRVGKGVFHHLDAGDRKHIAVSDGSVAVAWEDNRDGTPRVYVATKPAKTEQFDKPRKVSGEVAAYDPVILALPKQRFLIGWEENDAVWVRLLDERGLGPATAVAANSGQISLALSAPDRAIAVWSQVAGRHREIWLANLSIGKTETPVYASASRAVDPKPPEAEQQYPTVASVGNRVTVAWEDRRRGHTVLYYSHAADGKRFSVPQALNEVPPKRSEIYGKGTGVMRVSLVLHGAQGVAAVWLDKRVLAVGYDVYAAFSTDGGATFGPNELAQDDFGNNIRQWHAAIGANVAGLVAAAWDDDREGNADVWLSWREEGGWSDDLAVPGASGAGEQDAPALSIDGDGALHLIWIERETPEGPTRLRYLRGTPVQN